MAPSSTRPMQKLGGAVILVVAVLCVSVSVPTVFAQLLNRDQFSSTSTPRPHEDLCNPYYYRPSPKHPAYFLQRRAGGYFQEMPCAPGTVYNPDLCVCDFPKGAVMSIDILMACPARACTHRQHSAGLQGWYRTALKAGKGHYPPHRPYAKPVPQPTPKPTRYIPYSRGGKSFSRYPKTKNDYPPRYNDNSHYQDSYSGKSGYGCG